MKKLVLQVVSLVAFVVGLPVLAFAEDYVPGEVTTNMLGQGITMGTYVTNAITAIGGTIAVVLGGYFGFLLIRKVMRWGAHALG
jgi:hypothetical protein